MNQTKRIGGFRSEQHTDGSLCPYSSGQSPWARVWEPQILDQSPDINTEKGSAPVSLGSLFRRHVIRKLSEITSRKKLSTRLLLRSVTPLEWNLKVFALLAVL